MGRGEHRMAAAAELGAQGAYIAGRFVPIAPVDEIRRIDPATETPRPPLPCAGPADVEKAVVAAARSGWQATGRGERIAALDRLIAAIADRREDLARTISREIGAPIDFARAAQVGAALDHLAATRAALVAADGDLPVAPDRPADRVRYEPVGVAGLITPWNWPLNQVVLKVGGALAAGCPMVLKPSEFATDTALLFAACVDAARLPAGMVNVVPGGSDTGRALVTHPGVDVVSFTGSTRAGREIAVAAAPDFKRTILEMGGKSPNILFADCDLDTALRQGIAHCFRNNGQSCNAASRMLVAREVYDAAVARAAEIAGAFPVGRPDAPGGHIGPQVNAAQFERVQDLIASGIAEGARCVAGGPGRAPGFARGFYSRPTVFADVAPAMRLFREEVFGPVLTMTPFDDEAEGIRLANDTAYGLAGYVQTADPARADRVARALRAGMVQVNGRSRAPGAPFGGMKASGIGRESGLWGIRAFQEVKSISGAVAIAKNTSPDDQIC